MRGEEEVGVEEIGAEMNEKVKMRGSERLKE